jgi:hypothetical protein
MKQTAALMLGILGLGAIFVQLNEIMIGWLRIKCLIVLPVRAQFSGVGDIY